MFAEDSIELLKTSGIDFAKFEELGIDVQYFGELIMMSGLVLNEDVKWVSFHSSYDFGYLVKTLTCRELPMDEPAFMDSLHTYFPCIYDVKVNKVSPSIKLFELILYSFPRSIICHTNQLSFIFVLILIAMRNFAEKSLSKKISIK